jgi:hypothetical protein
MRRRGFLGAVGAALFAPVVIRTPGLLMPVRPLILTGGILPVGSLYEELCAITWRAYGPRLYDGLYRKNGLILRLRAA